MASTPAVGAAFDRVLETALVVRDALVIGRWREREQGSRTAHTRPPTDFDAHHVLVRTVECLHGQVQLELLCEPMFDYGRNPAVWTPVDGEPALEVGMVGREGMLGVHLLLGNWRPAA